MSLKVKLAIWAGILFAASFAVSTYAIDRGWYYGYFTNSYDSSGDEVLQNNANDGGGCSGYLGNRGAHYNGSTGGYDSIWPSVNSADSFISEIKLFLTSTRCDNGTANNAQNWDRTGAAFIIQTMIGTSRNRPPTAGEVADWENRVRSYAAAGRVNWNIYVCAAPNTFYQINRSDGSSSVNDVAWFNSTGCGQAIVFYKADGTAGYIIRRACANPLGDPLPLENGWYANGRSTVTDGVADAGDTPYSITTTPGSTLTFKHYIKNLGPSTSYNWYSIHGGNSVEGTYKADYYPNTSLSGSPSFTRYEAGIYHNWDGDGVDSPIGNNNFSVRWTRSDYFPAGTYTFTTATDDGVRLFVDGTQVINDWNTHGVLQNTATVNLTAGRHTVVMEYYQGAGGYYAAMWYSYMQGATKVSTAYDAQYYNTLDLSGSPVVMRTDPEVNFNWGGNAPVAGVNADFSARWTRYAYFTAGTYAFHTRSDDGVRLYVDNALVINDWNGHASTANFSPGVVMTEGVHKIVLEYFDGAYGADVGLSWASTIQGGTEGGYYAAGEERQVPSAAQSTVVVPNNATAGTRICQSLLWDWATNTGGEEMWDGGQPGSADTGGMACAIVSGPTATASCTGSSVIPTPNMPDPGDSYQLTVKINTAGPAQAVIDAGGKFFVNVTGPNPSGTNVGSNSDVPMVASGDSTNGVLTATPTFGATGSGGTFTVSYGLTGGTAVSCSKTFDVRYTPYFSVMGGDVSAGPGFGAGCVAELSTIKSYNLLNSAPANAGYYGSGSQLAAFALGQNTQFATNTTLSSGTGKGTNSSGGSVLQPSGLAFSGTGASGSTFGTTFGRNPTEDTVSHAGWCTPDYYGAAANATTAPTPLGTTTLNQALLDTHPTSGITYSVSGNLTINGPITLGNGFSPKRITLIVDNGNVTINGNVLYNGYTYVSGNANLSDIPQFRLMVRGGNTGGNIFIDKGVTQLNGFYHAQKGGANTGSIYTCATTVGGSPKYLTYTSGDTGTYSSTDSNYYSNCSNPLTIYGSVAAYKLKLNRSGGNWKTAGVVANRPAEQIIYAPELWLGTLTSTLPSTPQYDAITSLPPIL